MKNIKKTRLGAENYSRKYKFNGPRALGLLKSLPVATDPVEAVLLFAEMLVIESGMTEPPFAPARYAPLRRIHQILFNDMEVDGRLIPVENGFIVELKKNQSHERKNFTLAHEVSHTFFHGAVPVTKYKMNGPTTSDFDPEEERLCDIAASELLMPSLTFSAIAKDYLASPSSVIKIAALFETSTLATIIKLLQLNIWDATFVLWDLFEGQLRAKWVASVHRSVMYNSKLNIPDFKSSGVYETLISGKSTDGFEYLSREEGFNRSYAQSVLLNSSSALTCFTRSRIVRDLFICENPASLITSFEHTCVCDGGGWVHKTEGKYSHLVRCPAKVHKRSVPSPTFRINLHTFHSI